MGQAARRRADASRRLGSHVFADRGARTTGRRGLLLPVTRIASAVCLLALMLAMFPANVYVARMPHPPKSMTTRLSLRTATAVVYLAAAIMVAVGSS